MARADLLLGLVKTGVEGDITLFRKTAEAIAAEEHAKQHFVLAERLNNILQQSKTANTVNSGMTNDPDLQNAFYSVKPRKSLSDLVLSETITQSCMDFIQEHHRRDLLRSYNLEPRHRLLLEGAPGNGKTSLAEAFANELMLPFYVVKYEGVIGSYLGETAKTLDKLFDFIKGQRCVVFFDEFDAIAKERNDSSDVGEVKRVVNSLLKQIDMLPSHVVVIAATNHQGMLDDAIWRRFQLQLELPKPTKKMAIKWIEAFEKRVGHDLGYAASTLAEKLLGLSYSEFEDFTLDVQRQYVLALPSSEGKIKAITSRCLKIRTNRSKPEV